MGFNVKQFLSLITSPGLRTEEYTDSELEEILKARDEEAAQQQEMQNANLWEEEPAADDSGWVADPGLGLNDSAPTWSQPDDSGSGVYSNTGLNDFTGQEGSLDTEVYANYVQRLNDARAAAKQKSLQTKITTGDPIGSWAASGQDTKENPDTGANNAATGVLPDIRHGIIGKFPNSLANERNRLLEELQNDPQQPGSSSSGNNTAGGQKSSTGKIVYGPKEDPQKSADGIEQGDIAKSEDAEYNGKEKDADEKTMRSQLSKLKDDHLGKLSFASIYTANKALDVISKYNDRIEQVSEQLKIPKETIQAVLYRELICLNAKDIASDAVVTGYHNARLGNGIPVVNDAEEWLLGQLGDDSSTGIGQIFARTAIKAENEASKEANINKILDDRNENDVWNMWQTLRDDSTNIYYIGLVLKMEAKNQNVDDLSKASDEQIRNVIAAYNGGSDSYTHNNPQRYGTQTKEYFDLFKRYNTK